MAENVFFANFTLTLKVWVSISQSWEVMSLEGRICQFDCCKIIVHTETSNIIVYLQLLRIMFKTTSCNAAVPIDDGQTHVRYLLLLLEASLQSCLLRIIRPIWPMALGNGRLATHTALQAIAKRQSKTSFNSTKCPSWRHVSSMTNTAHNSDAPSGNKQNGTCHYTQTELGIFNEP